MVGRGAKTICNSSRSRIANMAFSGAASASNKYKQNLTNYWVCVQTTWLVSSGTSLTAWGEGASLGLVGHPSSHGVTIKMPYGVDVLHRLVSHPIFAYWVG